MTDTITNTNEVDLGVGQAPIPMGIQWATVGWTSEAGAGSADHADLGSTTNDGTTLIKITTYSGRTPGDPTTPGQAQGHQYLAQLLGPIFSIPPKGTRVLVAFPSGMETTPGAAVILGTLGGGGEVKRNLKPGDWMMCAPGGGAASLLVKANGSVTMMTTSDNTPTGKLVAFTLSPTGLSFDSPIGSQKHDATGWHLKTKAGPRIDMGGISIAGLDPSLTAPFSAYVTITAPTMKLAAGSVFLGGGSIFNPVMHSPVNTIMPPPGAGSAYMSSVQSQTVWIAP